MLRDCTDCREVTEIIGDKCCEFGRQLNSDKVNYYLTNPPGVVSAVNLEPGQKLLDRFTVKSLLGKGGRGAVYVAADELRSLDVALKVVPVESEFAANHLKNEIKLNCEVVDFSHVIRVHDVHSTRYGGTILLLVSMEYANGGSFRQWLHVNRDDIERRRAIGLTFFKQACLGISALHAVGVAHQDVKPENLLLIDGILKVSDLGLSRCIRGVHMGDNSHRSDDLGHLPSCTPAYAAPEQICAAHPDDIDHRADIHALGAILFEIYHPQCRPPFGGTYEQIRQYHLHRMPAPAIEEAEPYIACAIARCLQKNPADRYATVLELLNDLEGRMNECQSPQDNTERHSVEKIEQLWQQACQSVSESDLSTAGRLCGQILSVCPGHSDAMSMQEDVQSRYEKAGQFYKTIKAGIGSQVLDQLTSLLLEAVEIYPEHPDANFVQAQLGLAMTEHENVIENGIEAVGRGQLQAAQTSFERAWQLSPGSPVVKRLMDFVDVAQRQIETTRDSIDTALAQGRDDEAIALARELDQYIDEIKSIVQ